MSIILKEHIVQAYQQKNRKKRLLLYTFFKEKYFNNNDFPSQFIADRITEELGISITKSMVIQIRHHYEKKQDLPIKESSAGVIIKEKPIAEITKVEKKIEPIEENPFPESYVTHQPIERKIYKKPKN